MKVNKRTRAKKYGTLIYCPNCNTSHLVYHFSWSAIICHWCKTDIDKYDWKLEPVNFLGILVNK